MKTDNVIAQQILTDARRATLGVAAFNFTDIWDLELVKKLFSELRRAISYQ